MHLEAFLASYDRDKIRKTDEVHILCDDYYGPVGTIVNLVWYPSPFFQKYIDTKLLVFSVFPNFRLCS